MSSMRNAAPRRPHKERSQPTNRSKWGLLEKHKDYSLRAADYNLKKKKLSQLSRKVKEKHPDEFAYGMLSAETGTQGKHGRRSQDNKLGHDAVKLLKTQDQGYLKVAEARGRKEIQRVTEQLGLSRVAQGKLTRLDGEDGGVLDDVDGNAMTNDHERSDAGEMEAEETENVSPAQPRTKKQIAAEKDSLAKLRAERKRRKRLEEVRANRLKMLKKRQKEIMKAADQLDLQRAKMARTVGGVSRTGIKYKVRERKK